MDVFWDDALCSLADDVSKELTASIIRMPDYMVLHPRRQPSSNSSPWEPQISPEKILQVYHGFATEEVYN
jgi:hypothetical protein